MGIDLLVASAVLLWKTGILAYKEGPLSTYAPGDGYNRGKLACGDRPFTRQQRHIALRDYDRHGCGSPVLVQAISTGKIAAGTVEDAGPFGAVKQKGKGYRVWTGRRPPKGWRWRGAVDISVGMWVSLGRPRFLTYARILILRKNRMQQLVRGLGLECRPPGRAGSEAEESPVESVGCAVYRALFPSRPVCRAGRGRRCTV